MTTEENIKKEYFKEQEVKFDGLEININNLNNEIIRLAFKVNDKQITWKPKVDFEEENDYATIQGRKPMLIGDIPEKVKQIGKICKTKGSCTCIVEYSQMTTEQGTYNFITSIDQLNRWEIKSDDAEVTNLS